MMKSTNLPKSKLPAYFYFYFYLEILGLRPQQSEKFRLASCNIQSRLWCASSRMMVDLTSIMTQIGTKYLEDESNAGTI